MSVSTKNISKKQVSINMLANVVSYSANIIISFVLTPFLINTLGKETYSFYPIANTIVMYMSVLTTAMNTMTSRFVTVSLVRNKDEEANKYFSSTLVANLALSGFLMVPMIFIVIFIDHFMEVPINSVAAIKGLYALVFSSAIVNISAGVFGIATFAKNRIDLRSIRELVTAVIRLTLFVIFYRFFVPSIVYVGIVTLIVAVVNILFQCFYTKMLMPEIRIRKSNVSLSHVKEIFSSSCWSAINSFGNILLTGMSMVLANMLYGSSAAGSYSIVNTVPQFINGIIVMLVGVFYPIITYKYAQNDKEGLIVEIKNAQSMIGIMACSIISVFTALASDFFSLWTPGEDVNYLSLLSFVTIMPHFIIGCMWSLTNMNVVMNKVRIPAIYTLCSGLANVIIATLVYKIWSPGLLSLPIISSSLQIIWIGGFIPLYVCKNLKVKWNTFYLAPFKAVICSTIVIMTITKIKRLFMLDNWICFLGFGFVCGIFTIAFFAIYMIGINKIKTLLIIAVNNFCRLVNKKRIKE